MTGTESDISDNAWLVVTCGQSTILFMVLSLALLIVDFYGRFFLARMGWVQQNVNCRHWSPGEIHTDTSNAKLIDDFVHLFVQMHECPSLEHDVIGAFSVQPYPPLGPQKVTLNLPLS